MMRHLLDEKHRLASARTEPLRRLIGPRRLVAAAVVVVVAFVGVGMLLDDDPVQVTTDPPTTTTASVASDGPLRADGDRIERGSGVPIAVDPSGRFLYVRDEATEGGTGCEGGDNTAVFVEPVDGGERRQVLPADVLGGGGRIDLRFDGTGRVAARSLCEGFGASVLVATIGPDGTFEDEASFTPHDLDLGREVDAIVDLEWRGSDEIVATTWTLTESREHRHLYSLPLDGESVPTDLGIDDVVQVEVGPDGTIAVLTVDRRVLVGDESVATVPDASELRMTPSGGQLVLDGSSPNGLTVIDVGTLATRSYDVGAATAIVALDDGLVAYSIGEGGGYGGRFMAHEGSRIRREFVTRGPDPSLVVTPDLTRVFSVGHDDTASALYEQPLTR